VAVRVASADAIASASGPPVSPVVGASVVAASAARVTMRDDLAIAASSCGAVATLEGSASRCASAVGIGRQPQLEYGCDQCPHMRLVALFSRFLTGGG
jgi:hypothetical protein